MAAAPRVGLEYLPRHLKPVDVFTDWRRSDSYTSFWHLIWNLYVAAWARGAFESSLDQIVAAGCEPGSGASEGEIAHRRSALERVRGEVPVVELAARFTVVMVTTYPPFLTTVEAMRTSSPEWRSAEQQFIDLLGAAVWEGALRSADQQIWTRRSFDSHAIVLSSPSRAALLGARRAAAVNPSAVDDSVDAAERSIARFVSRLS